jgi:hypothetical protein
MGESAVLVIVGIVVLWLCCPRDISRSPKHKSQLYLNLEKNARRIDATNDVKSAIKLERNTGKSIKARDWICEATKEFNLDQLHLDKYEREIARLIIHNGDRTNNESS